MSNIRKEIDGILKSRGLTKRWLASKTNIAEGNLNRVLGNVSLENLKKIADALNIDSSLLLEPIRYSEMNNSILDNANTSLPMPDDANYRLVPLINSDAVGGMHKINDVLETDSEYIISYIPFVDAKEQDVCIQVKSDSMIPTCPPGCVVQIREVPNWQEYFGYGNLFVIQLKDGRRIIKEVTKYADNPKDYVLCISHNKNVPAEELPRNLIVSVWKVIRVLTDRGW